MKSFEFIAPRTLDQVVELLPQGRLCEPWALQDQDRLGGHQEVQGALGGREASADVFTPARCSSAA